MVPRFIPLDEVDNSVAINDTSKSEKLKTYLAESAKTLSGKFYYDSNFESEPDIYHYAHKAIRACQDLDLVKKKKFYNKDVNISSSVPSNLKFLKEDSGENTLHAAIGLTTECGEILEAIMKHKYEGKELDVVNIKEEIGDLMWYLAILLRDHDIDLFDAMEVNIKKLRDKIPLSIDDFTQPFKYLEGVKDYTGGFLVTLLKSEIEIDTQSRLLNIDLTHQKKKCADGDLLILYVFDISGSESKGEEKKFFITLEFDKLNGTLSAKGIISTKGNLSARQHTELERFCKIKNIKLK